MAYFQRNATAKGGTFIVFDSTPGTALLQLVRVNKTSILGNATKRVRINGGRFGLGRGDTDRNGDAVLALEFSLFGGVDGIVPTQIFGDVLPAFGGSIDIPNCFGKPGNDVVLWVGSGSDLQKCFGEIDYVIEDVPTGAVAGVTCEAYAG